MSAREEFYVGYLPAAPPALGRRTRALAALALAAALVLGALASALHGRLPAASFEYGTTRRFEGVLRERPVPLLEVARPGGAERSRYALVAPGKHGAAALVAGWDGRSVALEGTLAWRAGATGIEIVPGSLRALGEAAIDADAGAPERLGRRVLQGEIVDTKCWLGVMSPGQAKPHRACAVRCLSGGIPPMLRVRDPGDGPAGALLVGPEGEPLGEALLGLVAEPVRVEGELLRLGDLFVLYASAADVHRLP